MRRSRRSRPTGPCGGRWSTGCWRSTGCATAAASSRWRADAMATIPYVPTYLRATPPTIWPATSVLDFGAIGNGSTDDYPAITAALQALIAKGGGTLVFPNDRDFRIATPGVHGIHLAGQSNITIMMGERSRLIMDNM